MCVTYSLLAQRGNTKTPPTLVHGTVTSNGISPNRLEAHRVDCRSLEAHKSYTIAQNLTLCFLDSRRTLVLHI